MKKSKIFLGCLPPNTNESELFDYFRGFCDISDMKLKYRSNKQCAGYGTFTCLDTSKVTLIINTPHYHKGRSLECRPYLSKDELKAYHEVFNKRRLYVGNLPEDISDLALFHFFEYIAPVTRAYVTTSRDELGRRYGFVVFRDQSALDIIRSQSWYFQGRQLVIKKVSRDKNLHKRKGLVASELSLSKIESGDMTLTNLSSYQEQSGIEGSLEDSKFGHISGGLREEKNRLFSKNWVKRQFEYFDGQTHFHSLYQIPHLLKQDSTMEAVLTQSESEYWNHTLKNLRFSH